MHRPTSVFLILFALFAAALPVTLRAQPIVTALPTNKSAWYGTSTNANITFDVAAFSADSGTLSYQWGTTTGMGQFTALPADNATYNGTTTANLTINTTDASLDGTKYKCKITEGSNTITSSGATLSVFNTPSRVPTLTLSSTSVAANTTANITLTIGNLSSGDTVRIQRFLDRNSDGKAEVDDPVVQSLVVTDGQTAAFGGVTDPTIPGDDDGTQDGAIHTHINLGTSNEIGQLAGNYVIKISSSTGEFLPLTQVLTVTQPGYGQSISGQVQTSGSAPVPYASVALLQIVNQNPSFIGGTVADVNGDFTLNAPAGSNYTLLCFNAGNVSSFNTAPSFTLSSSSSLTGKNIPTTPATVMITGKTQDSSTSNSIPAVQFFASGQNTNSVAAIDSNSDGNFVIPVTADMWQLDTSDNSLPPLGYLRPQGGNNGSNKPTADTTGGNANLTVAFAPVNALVYGTLTNGSNPIPNLVMDASDNAGTYDATGTSNTTGYYVIGVNGASGTGTNVNVQADTSNGTQAALNGLIPFSGNSFTVFPATATQANFTTSAVTAYLNGTVTDISNSTVLANLPIQIELSNSNNFFQEQTTTDSNGNFSFGVYGGSWNIQLDYGGGNNTQQQTLATLVGQSLNETAIDNQNINNIAYSVLNATSNITGTVVDGNSQDVSNTNVVASSTTTIGGLFYTSYVSTNNDGFYTLPIVNGTNASPLSWNVSAGNGPSVYLPQTVVTNTASSNPISNINFTPSPYLVWVQNTFGNGQLGDSNTATETPANDGIPNLVKYAFNLAPSTNQQANLPKATLSGGKLTLVFTQSATDITYTVQSSTDLTTWTTSDPNLSVVTNNNQVTATYTLTGHPVAFLRILVTLASGPG